MSFYENLFELLLEKQQSTSEEMKEIISERISLWNESIMPKIEKLYHRNKEKHLEDFLKQQDEVNNLLWERMKREEEQQYRRVETKVMVEKQTQDMMEHVKKANRIVVNSSSVIQGTGDTGKLLLKIPTKGDNAVPVNEILNQVEQKLELQYQRNNQRDLYESAKVLVEKFKQVEEGNRTVVVKEDSDHRDTIEEVEDKKNFTELLDEAFQTSFRNVGRFN